MRPNFLDSLRWTTRVVRFSIQSSNSSKKLRRSTARLEELKIQAVAARLTGKPPPGAADSSARLDDDLLFIELVPESLLADEPPTMPLKLSTVFTKLDFE